MAKILSGTPSDTFLLTQIDEEEGIIMKQTLIYTFPPLLVLIIIMVSVPVGLYSQYGHESRLFSPASDTNFSGVVGAGARAFGMGGAFIAIADDATAASWNPGGLGQLEKPEFSFVSRFQNCRTLQPAQLVTPGFFIGPKDNDGNSYGFDFISLTYPVHIGKVKLVPQISFQRSISFDLKTTMNDVRTMISTPEYFQDIYANDIQDFVGGIDNVSFSLGTKIFKRINIGFSTNIMMNGLDGSETSNAFATITSLADPGKIYTYEAQQKESIKSEMEGINFNFGILVDVTENFKIGVVYKSSATIDLNYDVTSETTTNENGVITKSSLRYGANSYFRWPQTIGIGLAFRPSDPLTISVDFTSTRWSKAILRNFLIKDIDNKDVILDVYFPTFAEFSPDKREKQVDSVQIRGGLEYIIIGKKNLLIPLRIGLFGDTQYYSDAAGNKVTLFGITGGMGIKKGIFSFDIAALYEFGNYLKSNTDYSETLFSDFRIYASFIISFGK